VPSPARRRRGTFAAFRRPVLGDPVFWLTFGLALVAGLVVGGGLMVVMGIPDTAVVWLWPIIGAVLAGWLAFKLLAMGINTSRALEQGAAPADEGRARGMEAGGRAAGAALGKGARTLLGGRRSPAPSATRAEAVPPSASAAPTTPTSGGEPSPPSRPEVTVDKAARVLGSMVGRRLGGRKQP
jgi:hypothetical protein